MVDEQKAKSKGRPSFAKVVVFQMKKTVTAAGWAVLGSGSYYGWPTTLKLASQYERVCRY